MTQTPIRRRARPIRALIFTGVLLTGAPVSADVTEAALGFLRAQGYEVVLVERTWLGRVRIEAQKDDIAREIVMDRTTGEILRDRIAPASEEEGAGLDGEPGLSAGSFLGRLLDSLGGDDGFDDGDDQPDDGEEDDGDEDEVEEDGEEDGDDEGDDDGDEGEAEGDDGDGEGEGDDGDGEGGGSNGED